MKPLNSQHVPPEDLFSYARSFHDAAKKLALSFRPDPDVLPLSAAYPVVFMYRHSIELYLKAIVLGDGGNFLRRKPDPISVSKSHSASWLAQFVCQIVIALKWEDEFNCEGIKTVTDFIAVIEEVNSVDPGSYTFRCPVDPNSQSSVGEFARKMDALIGLLESTGDGLAAEWDLRSEPQGSDVGWNGGGFEPTIH